MIETNYFQIEDLVVNAENDRHGILKNELEAVNWLLKNKRDAMRSLAKDIAEQKRIYEPPLIKKTGNKKYTVFDGNRRITCLKLLLGFFNDLFLEDKEYYDKLSQDYNCKDDLPKQIQCQISDDQDEIDTIIQRRHAPTNTGEKRINWSPYEKENFLERTGRSNKINFAKKIQDMLHREGFLNENESIKSSTFNRLFSSNLLRERVGLTIKNNDIYFLIQDRNKIMTVLSYIARLLNSGKITLTDVWSNATKNNVLDKIELEGLLPTAQEKIDYQNQQMDGVIDFMSDKQSEAANKQTQNSSVISNPPKKVPPKLSRNHILPPHLECPKHGKNLPSKIYNLFLELQYHLDIQRHLISSSVAFRVLIELLTHAYAKKHDIEFQKDERLSSKIDRVYKTMPAKFQTDNSSFLKNLSQKNSYFSTGTMNAFVHSTDSVPIAADLIRLADNFEKYISALVEDLNSQQ